MARFSLEDACSEVYEKVESMYKGSEITLEIIENVIDEHFEKTYSPRQRQLIKDYYRQEYEEFYGEEVLEESKTNNQYKGLKKVKEKDMDTENNEYVFDGWGNIFEVPVTGTSKITKYRGYDCKYDYGTKQIIISNKYGELYRIGLQPTNYFENPEYWYDLAIEELNAELEYASYGEDVKTEAKEDKKYIIAFEHNGEPEFAFIKKLFTDPEELENKEKLGFSITTERSNALKLDKKEADELAERLEKELPMDKITVVPAEEKVEEKLILSDEDKLKILQLDGLISQLQTKFDVSVICSYDEDTIEVYLKGSILAMIDAIEYMKSFLVAREDLEFHMSDKESDGTVLCTIKRK